MCVAAHVVSECGFSGDFIGTVQYTLHVEELINQMWVGLLVGDQSHGCGYAMNAGGNCGCGCGSGDSVDQRLFLCRTLAIPSPCTSAWSSVGCRSTTKGRLQILSGPT